MAQQKLLGIYLNDHLAGSVAGRELAARCRSNNRGSSLATYMDKLQRELEEDQAALLDVMRRFGVRPSGPKRAAGWLAEKAGRFKLNGQLTGYSPLSRVLELEGLCLGVQGKVSLWRSLQELSVKDGRLAGVDLDRLERRAERQLAELEKFRRAAAARAFS